MECPGLNENIFVFTSIKRAADHSQILKQDDCDSDSILLVPEDQLKQDGELSLS